MYTKFFALALSAAVVATPALSAELQTPNAPVLTLPDTGLRDVAVPLAVGAAAAVAIVVIAVAADNDDNTPATGPVAGAAAAAQ